MTFTVEMPRKPHIVKRNGQWIAQDKAGFAIGYGVTPTLALRNWQQMTKVMEKWHQTNSHRELFIEAPGTRHGGT